MRWEAWILLIWTLTVGAINIDEFIRQAKTRHTYIAMFVYGTIAALAIRLGYH
jgi:hypothetical protein